MLRCVRDDVFLTNDEKLLMMILATYRQVYTLECNPKVDWLAVSMGKSRRSTYTIINTLEDKGYIVSIRRGFNMPSNYYFAHDFKAAFMAYHCPEFTGNKNTLLKASKKKWARKIAETPLFCTTSCEALDCTTIYKKDSIKRTMTYDNDYICPHCGNTPPQETSSTQ